MIDMHTHILPGVDDGCKDYGEALKMVKMAIDDGIEFIVLTPHQEVAVGLDGEQLKKKFLTFKQWFVKQALDIKFVLGSEIKYSADIIPRLNNKRFLTMNDTKIVMVKFPFETKTNIEDIVWRMQQSDYQVIVSHIQEYKYLTLKDIERIKNRGALIHIDAKVFLDKNYDKWIKTMVKEKLIDFVGSDAHDTVNRPPLLREAYEAVEKKFGFDYARHIFFQNAKTMIIDRKTMYLDD